MNNERRGKIGVLIENHFDETEYTRFQEFFPQNGFDVEFMSHLWNQESITFNGNDVDTTGIRAEVRTEINNVNLSDYDGIILIGGYAMDRLRYQVNPLPGCPNQAPAVNFIRRAMSMNCLKIGTICHSLWLLCADPSLMEGRRVTCAHNIMCDVENAGGILVYSNDPSVGLVDTFIDGNLITGRHPGVVEEFMQVYLQELNKQCELKICV